MGNSASSQRHCCGGSLFYWGMLLFLMTPPEFCFGWNMPFFGGERQSNIAKQPMDDATMLGDTLVASGTAVGMNGAAQIMADPLSAPITDNIIGPLDAPHLRYIPSYFSNQIPDKLKEYFPKVLSMLSQARVNVYHLLWYKPPVGIVTAWGFIRVFERMYGLYCPPPPTSGEEALADAEGKLSGIIKSLMPGSSFSSSSWGKVAYAAKGNGNILKDVKSTIEREKLILRKMKRRNRRGRSFDLDRGDFSYENFGGVDNVRVRLCQEGLSAALAVKDDSIEHEPSNTSLFGNKTGQKTTTSSNIDISRHLEIALSALQLHCPPRGSREHFVERLADALSNLQEYVTLRGTDIKSGKAPPVHDQNLNIILTHSSKLIEVRTLDALLRTLRDRHIVVSFRLRRAQNYWRWRVNLTSGRLGRLTQRFRFAVMSVMQVEGDDVTDRNQKEIARITAACERELLWLGTVEKLLLERPTDMASADIVSVIDDMKYTSNWWGGFLFEVEKNQHPQKKSNEATFASVVRILVEGKSRFWLHKSDAWARRARQTIADSLDATIGSSFTPINNVTPQIAASNGEGTKAIFVQSEFLNKWASYHDGFCDTTSWLGVLQLVDYAASHQRTGEKRYYQLSDLSSQLKQYDFLGIPSTALLLAAANSLHDNVIGPHSREIIDFIKSIFQAIWGIVEFRFYTPMKDIVLDLLNKRPRMVDPFALMNEQTSLDNMLLDLGVGDGTRHTRAVALAAASRMYEQEVAGGAIRGIVRGNVARLMLIQIQQLKADLLQAMDQIDNLVDSNRLNVQLVASIPAVLILVFGTRALLLFWSNLKMKDLRLPKDVHAEMSDYLKKIEEVLILSNPESDDSVIEPKTETSNGTTASLGPKDLGQLLLFMHLYLNLLDYMSPPFPNKNCDSIHHTMQNLLTQGVTTSRQLQLLKVIQEKHNDFLKIL